MAGIDWIILAVIGVSALVSFVRGFLKEAVSLGTWVVAGVVTLLFTSKFAQLLPRDTIESPTARLAISGLILFFGCMMIGGLINWLVGKAIGPSTLGVTDRLIGIGFGMARGAVIVAVLVLMANLVPTLKQETWWRQSTLLPRFQSIAEFIHSQLPEDIASHFDFNPTSI